jgi:UDP-N-acetylmuramoyl-L-alanyl-D-glutamate--2,6-diaminopimelate ligase
MTLTPRCVPLAKLAAAVGGELPAGGDGTLVRDVVLDTRAVVDGALFCCVPGSRMDGHDLAGQAVAAGAAALCVERPVTAAPGVPRLRVRSVRAALAPLAAAFFGYPSSRLELVGITGTNGKTTTAFMLEAIFRAAGLRGGLSGTVEIRIGGERRPVVHTTPEAPDLQRLLAEMADSGVQAAALEVSSHALAYGRVDATHFRVAVFTNLTPEHLDFHRDMEDYFQAKRRLFTPAFSDLAVVNLDDPYGRRLAGELARGGELPVVTFGRDPQADWRASAIDSSLAGTSFQLDPPARRASGRGDAVHGRQAAPEGRDRPRQVRLQLAGYFNAANALGALAAADALGIDLDTAVAGLASLQGVPGRFERVAGGQGVTVLVDYAHTPDSLENVLRAARAVTAGRVLLVFGCGGDRDRAKRPLMGEIAGKLSDLAVVTSDNPRSEDPSAIIEQIIEGLRRSAGPDRYQVVVDRRAAIRAALALAAPGDLVLVAGKGHEQGQELAGGVKVPFDDRVVVAEELARLGRRPQGPAGGAR